MNLNPTYFAHFGEEYSQNWGRGAADGGGEGSWVGGGAGHIYGILPGWDGEISLDNYGKGHGAYFGDGEGDTESDNCGCAGRD